MLKLIGVNKMLDKEGEEFERLLESYSEKQKKPLKIPYKKMKALMNHAVSVYGAHFFEGECAKENTGSAKVFAKTGNGI